MTAIMNIIKSWKLLEMSNYTFQWYKNWNKKMWNKKIDILKEYDKDVD